ncbi:MAG TPA: di-heme oxidoredictase family protein [Longimicrobiales bacterium]|nr:di-heme oxidoredictase family protein [Longimicrobiales bacterium]
MAIPGRRLGILAVAPLLLSACAPLQPEAALEVRSAAVGDPLPGLTPEELARFEAGKAAFSKVYTQEEGLGPTHNENSCNACHSWPTVGGSGAEEYDVHATFQGEDGRCDLLDAHGGGNVRDLVTPIAAAVGVTPERIPPEANQHGVFTAPALWGVGLVEAIPDSVIEALADPDDANGDGISGRVGRDAQGRMGRLRRKADRNNLEGMVSGGLLVALGITTPQHPEERVFSVDALPAGADPAPDPEEDQATVDIIEDYLRFLGVPPRNMPTDPAELARVAVGEKRFVEVGCAACHVPTLTTGPSPVAALDRKPVPLYSDLLLHDMGPAGANICSAAATPSEFRTEILMGIATRTVFMHDAKAPSLWEAIAQHGGEGAASVDAFNALPELERHALVAFLLTL